MDEVAAAVQFEGSVYIFMRSGKVFKMGKDHNGLITFRLMHNMIS